MKIKVKDLRPNPFRDLNVCPIDRKKVERLKLSIEELDFWDNLLARPSKNNDGTYELAYGYHRLEALRSLGWEEVDIPVKNLSDETMIKIMGKENQEWYGKNTAVVIETVKVAKEFIEEHIAEKNGVYDDLDKWCKDLYSNEVYFNRDVAQNCHISIGRSVIQNFLGKTWNRATIQFALKIIEGETSVKAKDYDVTEYCDDGEEESLPVKISVPISQEAVEKFPVVGQARAFVETVTRDNDVRTAFPTEEAQAALADEVVSSIQKDGKIVSSSSIVVYAKEKAKEVLDNSTEIGSGVSDIQKQYREINSQPKPPSATDHIIRILKRTKEIPDFRDQKVLNMEMAQAMMNDLYEAERNIQKYREGLFGILGIHPDEDCIYYDCYPTCTDFSVDTIEDALGRSKLDVEIEDYEEYGDGMDEESDEILDEYVDNLRRRE